MMETPNFHLIPAFSLEILAAELSQQLRNQHDPFEKETVLVMNYAQRVWLQQFIAAENGICANIEFRTPEDFFSEKVQEDGSGEKRARELFARIPLTWRIFKRLKKDGGKTFPYRGGKSEDFILLAELLADLFWRYQSFRPEMISAWQSDGDDPFASAGTPEFKKEYTRQKALWRQLDLKDITPPAVAYLDFLAGRGMELSQKRLFVFAPTALPRIHLELLYRFSKTTEIFFYYHNLSGDLWTETASAKQILKERSKYVEPRKQLESELKWQELVGGNELLTSWGKAARPLAMRLVDDGLLDGEIDGTLNTFPARDSLLHNLQADIRENINEPMSELFSKEGESLRIHVAHSAMREMEILRDDMIEIFSKDKTIAPRDVLVMLPDIEAYAPFILAAFSDSGIPFSLADKQDVQSFRGIAAFMDFLKIAQGEIPVSEVLDLLNAAPLCRGLGLGGDDVPALRKILVESNVRWGFDAEFRRGKITREGDEFVSENFRLFLRNNSWAFALQRGALAYMLGEESSNIVEFGDVSIASMPNVAENTPSLMGKIARLIDVLRVLCNAFSSGERTVIAWCDFLKKEILDEIFIFEGGDEVRESAVLYGVIASLRDSATLAGLDEDDKVSLKTVITLLESQSWESKYALGMLRGKVTFCGLQPLRNIPAKAIYIAGMSNGKFPRPSRKPSYDLIANWPKKLARELIIWDRSSRDEDCLLILEAMLAAKKYLRFSYVGRSQTSNSDIPPCSPLQKLISYLGDSGPWLCRHTLSGERYCGIESGKENALHAARTFPLSDEERVKFASAPTEMLIEFYQDPARFICKNRLSLKERWNGDHVPDDDPLDDSLPPKLILNDAVNEMGKRGNIPDIKKFCQKEVECARQRGEISALVDSGIISEKTLAGIKCIDDFCEFNFRQGMFLQVCAKVNSWPARVYRFFRALEIAESYGSQDAQIISFPVDNKKICYMSVQGVIALGSTLAEWRERFLHDLEFPPILFRDIPTDVKDAEALFDGIKEKYQDCVANSFYGSVVFGDSPEPLCKRIMETTFKTVSMITAETRAGYSRSASSSKS